MKQQIKQKAVATDKKEKAAPIEGRNILQKLDDFCEKRLNVFFISSLIIATIISLALFDVRVSLTGDDASYILRAKQWLDAGILPDFQGPFYPFFLAPFIKIFGVNVVLLKSLSLLCILGFLAITFFTLKKRVPAFLLCSFLLIMSINGELLYFSSQTYSEAFYLLVSACFIWFYVTYFLDKDTHLVQTIVPALIVSCLLLCLTLTRSVGLVGIITVLAYGVLHKKRWQETLVIFVCFGVVYGLWLFTKNLVWESSNIGFSGQLSTLLLKDAYNPNGGDEDISGFFTRFITNSKNYLSYHLYEVLGLRKTSPYLTGPGIVAFLTFAVGLLGLPVFFKKNKTLVFLTLFAGIFLVVTFVIMQSFWNQPRLIVPCLPYLVIVLLGVLYYVPDQKHLTALRYLLPILVVVVLVAGLERTSDKIKEASKIKSKYSGLTPDWINYLQMSEWAAKNTSKENTIICRKPSLSFIYSEGRGFTGISSVPNGPGDSLVNRWRKAPGKFISIPSTELKGSVTARWYNIFTQNLSAFYQCPKGMFVIVECDSILIDELKRESETLKIAAECNVERFVSGLGDLSGNSAIYPDTLLNILRRKSVSHVITANLRSVPTQKTERTINTVERYLTYVEQKYPGIFVKVHQIGTDENEPACLLKIDYEKAKR